MGCIQSKPNYIKDVDGNDEDFHTTYFEDTHILGEGEFGMVKRVYQMKKPTSTIHNHNNNENDEYSPADAAVFACKILHKGMVLKQNVVYTPLQPTVLQTEVEMLRALRGNHHYCLCLQAVYESPRHVYIVTELCQGGVMMEYVARQSVLDILDVSRIAFQLLDAIAHCASHHIIHRDVKPDNVMFLTPNPKSELRLIDFGSGCMDKEGDDPIIHTTYAGSAFYVSPEMFQRTYTQKTDVWSIGVTLYVLVAGYPSQQLQKSFNILHKSKHRNLKDLIPNDDNTLPDSYFDLLEQLLTYRHKMRKSAQELLTHEFVQLYHHHQQQDEDVLLLNTMQDSSVDTNNDTSRRTTTTTATATTTTTVSNGTTSTARITTTTKSNSNNNIILSGSVQRHYIFLDYCKFERGVTTLIVTLVGKKDLFQLLERLQKANNNNNDDDDNTPNEEETEEDVVQQQQTLNIIKLSKLKTILTEMKQEQWYV